MRKNILEEHKHVADEAINEMTIDLAAGARGPATETRRDGEGGGRASAGDGQRALSKMPYSL